MSLNKEEMEFLICDDLPLIRQLLASSLRANGYKKIEEAEDGKVGLEKITKKVESGKPYTIVFMDWMMPTMTGLDVIKACRNDPKLKDTLFIMVTAERDQKNIVQALSSGVKDYIIKPFNAAILNQKIERVMGIAPKGTAK